MTDQTLSIRQHILLFAIPKEDIKIPTVDFWRNEITVTSSYGAGPVDLEESLDLILRNKVNVKATTSEGLGFSGREEGIAAWAAALLEETDSGEDEVY